MKKTKVYTSWFFLLFEKLDRAHKPLKVAAAKNFFFVVYVTDTTCFDECFLFHTQVIIFHKRLLQHRHVVTLIGTSFLKEVRILCYLHINSAMIILKLQN